MFFAEKNSQGDAIDYHAAAAVMAEFWLHIGNPEGQPHTQALTFSKLTFAIKQQSE